MAAIEITYFRANAGFSQQFDLKQNGVDLDLTTLSSPTVRWHFKDSAGAKTFLDWDGTPVGPNNNGAKIPVTTGFFGKNEDYDCAIEVFDNLVLIFHSQENFIVHIKEPAGVHTD